MPAAIRTGYVDEQEDLREQRRVGVDGDALTNGAEDCGTAYVVR